MTRNQAAVAMQDASTQADFKHTMSIKAIKGRCCTEDV